MVQIQYWNGEEWVNVGGPGRANGLLGYRLAAMTLIIAPLK